jgi:hypothetical protein
MISSQKSTMQAVDSIVYFHKNNNTMQAIASTLYFHNNNSNTMQDASNGLFRRLIPVLDGAVPTGSGDARRFERMPVERYAHAIVRF